jgi:ABC-type glycerol-3-phosphate transport system substrate-binding protein
MLRKVGFSRFLALLLVLCFPLSACGGTEPSPGPAAAQNKELSGSLKVYYFSPKEGVDIYSPAISTFISAHPGLVVEPEAFSDPQELQKRIAEDKAAGREADVLLLTGDAGLDAQRMASEGGYADLAPYLQQDAAYTKDAYYDVLHAGIVEGKQAILPLALPSPSPTLPRNCWIKEI